MIVKNEQHVLLRCLRSVRHLIDCWLIVDTGSTDGTQTLINEYSHGLPGEVVERPWMNFGHNRSEAVALARPRADYLLTLDADEYLDPDPGFTWPSLTEDAYQFTVESGETTYGRIQLVRSSLPWRYEGVLHEYITCDGTYTQAQMQGLRTVRLLEGARSRDPHTYRKDAAILEAALRQDPQNARYTFYLAQSYRDAREPQQAMDWYRRRAGMGGFAEEVWYSLYEIAKLQQALGTAWDVVKRSYLAAFAFRPQRAEPLYRIGLYYQLRQEYGQAFVFFLPAMEIVLPKGDVLFLEQDVYRFLLPLEYAVACYWLGRHGEAIAVTDRLLADEDLTPERRQHLHRNRQYSVDALQAASC